MGSAASSNADLDAVLARFRIEPTAIATVAAGRYNTHWRVTTPGGDYALRRYNQARLASSIPYEHAMLEHVAARGWPVAAPVKSRDGATVVESEGRCYALFPWLPGQPGPAHSTAHLRVKGRLLARLHRDMASFGAGEQRAGFGRVWELDLPLQSSRFTTFNEMLREFGREHARLASGIRAQRYRSLRELTRSSYGDLADVEIHGDFQRDNLLFDRGELTGVLDFDNAHRDARVVDLAWSIISDCAEPPAETAIDPRLAAALVGGYAAHTPLSDAELRLIVPLLRAHNVAMCAWSVRRYLESGDADTLRRLDRRVSVRLPQLEARAAAIEEAIASTHGSA
ncbi:MAG: homoserine kinase [Chloroflexi bacterium]|nr:homoserine kinase [Chloroflexota bacterium]